MLNPGSYTLGPDDGQLTVRTGKTGAAAKAGHNLVIAVTSWHAELTLAPDSAQSTLSLTADSHSLRVLEGSGGIQALGEDDIDNIRQTIDSDVLKGTVIAFRSGRVTGDGEGLTVDGELELSGATRPLSFTLAFSDDGRLTGSAAFKQSEWGMKPYSALFGTLKVTDEVQVTIDAQLS
jgi:polyisoprenoid-binding protein YceI